jgi:cytochrome c peroxidase
MIPNNPDGNSRAARLVPPRKGILKQEGVFRMKSSILMVNPHARFFAIALLVVLMGVIMGTPASAQSLPNLSPLPNGSGFLETYNVNNAPISLTGAFFQSLGTNGRSCASCHLPTEGWSVSASEVQLRFLLTRGLDPIFRTNDGSNCDQNVDTSTLEGRRKAYSLLLSRGLIRVSLPVPAGAQFTVESVSNPYGCSLPRRFRCTAVHFRRQT